jgi:hypothetical protein
MYSYKVTGADSKYRFWMADLKIWDNYRWLALLLWNKRYIINFFAALPFDKVERLKYSWNKVLQELFIRAQRRRFRTFFKDGNPSETDNWNNINYGQFTFEKKGKSVTLDLQSLPFTANYFRIQRNDLKVVGNDIL